jgi:hypothetical protein
VRITSIDLHLHLASCHPFNALHLEVRFGFDSALGAPLGSVSHLTIEANKYVAGYRSVCNTVLTCSQNKYMNPATMNPPSLEGWWKCCGGEESDCGREVNPELNQETCPECGHSKCDSCDKIDTPSPIPEEYGVSGSQYYSNILHPSNYSQRTSNDHDCQHQHIHGLEPVEYTRRPSTRGWWHCCQCGADNNPAVSGWTCPICYHDKCDYDCYILQR